MPIWAGRVGGALPSGDAACLVEIIRVEWESFRVVLRGSKSRGDMNNISNEPPETARRHVVSRFTVLTVGTLVYPILFWLAYSRDPERFSPPYAAWVIFVVTVLVGGSMLLVLVALVISLVVGNRHRASPADATPSLGQLLGSVVVLSLGLPVAVAAGGGAGMAGWKTFMYQYSAGARFLGLLVGGAVAAVVVRAAWAVSWPRH